LGPLLKCVLGGAWTEGFETPLLTHAIFGLLVGGALAISLWRRSVIQLPNMRLSAAMLCFFGVLFASVGLSQFRFVSMAALAEWLIYGVAFFASVAVLGRGQGPRFALFALFAGTCVIAIYGIGIEYQSMRTIDPNHRIFAGWINPNATAGILLLAMILGMGLARAADRTGRLLIYIGITLQTVTLLLTGSKAGFGALGVGILVFALLTILWLPSKEKWKPIGFGVIALVVGLAMFTAIQRANAPIASTAGSLGRIGNFTDSQTQSLGFRKLLWQGSMDLSLQHPTGYGLGTYRFEGSRPGLTTQTQLAHNNFLQLAVESSWLSVALLVVIFALWIPILFRGARAMPAENSALRSSLLASIGATMAHGLFESNLYYFGIGLSMFMLLGIGICLAADSVAPEFTPKSPRVGFGFIALLPAVMLLYSGYAEYQRARIRYEITEGNFSEARELALNLVGLAPMDGEAWSDLYLLDPQRREEAIENAAQVTPSPRMFRGLAQVRQNQKKFASADAAIQQALVRDPNNLNTLSDGLENALASGDIDHQKLYANRMLQVEKTPYYQIRSLPQLVETSTVQAREYLAKHSTGEGKLRLLQGALDISVQYATVTVPEVKRFASIGGYVDETTDKAIAKVRKGLEIAKELAELYRSSGNGVAADKVEAEAGLLADALESLGGSK
ncbi:MAG TPA: O-antigen ligase family protein, partial [Fimbriimonadaceae bacterium]|nr:O-antigen ligase family protein [Fimbriimonadaceae bacterium]